MLTATEKEKLDKLYDKLLNAVIDDVDFDPYEWLSEKEATELEKLMEKE